MSKILKNSNQKDVETLVMEYANLSSLFGNAVETGNHKDANKIYKELRLFINMCEWLRHPFLLTVA